MTRCFAMLVLALGVGCGDNGQGTPDARTPVDGPPDAEPDSAPDAPASCGHDGGCPALRVEPPGMCPRTFGANLRVSNPAPSYMQNGETAIAADGQGHVVAVWIASSTTDQTGVAWSDDGGQTFTRGAELFAANGYHNDPVVVAESDGSFYVVWLGYDAMGGTDHIWGTRSTDHGHSFGTPRAVNDARTQGLDKPWIHAAGGTLYVTYAANNLGRSQLQTVYMVISTDHGATWSSAIQVSPDAHDSANLARIAADASYVYVSYVNAPGSADGSTQNAVYVARKTLAGPTFGSPVRASGAGESVVFDDTPIVSTAGGLGLVYVDGNLTTTARVAFVRSSDSAMTWSRALHIDDDGCMGVHMLPELAASADGRLHAVFYDNRFGDATGALWYAVSSDGGQSFGVNEFVSDQPFPFTTARMTNLWLGDYVGLAAAGGRIHASWTDPRNGMQSQVYVANGPL